MYFIVFVNYCSFDIFLRNCKFIDYFHYSQSTCSFSLSAHVRQLDGASINGAISLFHVYICSLCAALIKELGKCTGGEAMISGCFISFSPQKFTFSPQSIFYPLFLNEGSRIRKTRLSMLHSRFER